MNGGWGLLTAGRNIENLYVHVRVQRHFKHRHIVAVPACISDSLTNMLPHWNAMLKTQVTTPHHITV